MEEGEWRWALKDYGDTDGEKGEEVRTSGIGKTPSMGAKVGVVPSVLEERAGGKQQISVGLGRTGEPGLIN